jgi:hypothetical protein
MAHSRQYGAFEYRAIERIRAAEQKLAAVVRQSHTEPRDLSAYDTLPNWSRPTQESLHAHARPR